MKFTSSVARFCRDIELVCSLVDSLGIIFFVVKRLECIMDIASAIGSTDLNNK